MYSFSSATGSGYSDKVRSAFVMLLGKVEAEDDDPVVRAGQYLGMHHTSDDRPSNFGGLKVNWIASSNCKLQLPEGKMGASTQP